MYLEFFMKKEILVEDYFNCVKFCEIGVYFGVVEECDLLCILLYIVVIVFVLFNGILRSVYCVLSD